MDTEIYLRPILFEDTDRIIKWRNSDSVKEKFIYQEPFTREGQLEWLRTMIDTGKAVQMLICLREGNRPVGSVYIRDIDRKNNKAEYGIFIGEDDVRGRGIGTAAAKLMICYSFEELKLHRLFLRVFADNVRAIRSYEKAGFQREAYLRDDVFIDGCYRDMVLMGVINEG